MITLYVGGVIIGGALKRGKRSRAQKKTEKIIGIHFGICVWHHWKADRHPITFCHCLQCPTTKEDMCSCDRTKTDRQHMAIRTKRGIPGSSGMGWSSSASASVFSSVEPPYGSSSFTTFTPAAAFFCLLSFSTLCTKVRKGQTWANLSKEDTGSCLFLFCLSTSSNGGHSNTSKVGDTESLTKEELI